jgi:hypothetical protein
MHTYLLGCTCHLSSVIVNFDPAELDLVWVGTSLSPVLVYGGRAASRAAVLLDLPRTYQIFVWSALASLRV